MAPNTREMKPPASSSPSKKGRVTAANQAVGGAASRGTQKVDKLAVSLGGRGGALNQSLGGKGGAQNQSQGDSKRPATAQ